MITGLIGRKFAKKILGLQKLVRRFNPVCRVLFCSTKVLMKSYCVLKTIISNASVHPPDFCFFAESNLVVNINMEQFL